MTKQNPNVSATHAGNGSPDSTGGHLGAASVHLAKAADKVVEGVQVANVAARQALRDGLNGSGPELRAAGGEVRAAGSSAVDAAQQQFSALGARTRELADSSGSFIRERPLAALGIAVASGFLLSRLLRR
jgi:ElaB/YqjD/DUF883 family membrane-anchored ribosome-binding protein